MKRGTPDHPKVRALARQLGISRVHAVGILECLWQWAAQYCPDGGLSKWSPASIAEAVDWLDAEQLLAALKHTDCGFLDEDGMIHDWPEHCEDAVHMRLARAGKRFYCGCTPTVRRMERSEREKLHVERVVCARHAHDVRTESALPLPLPLPKPLKPPTPLQGGDQASVETESQPATQSSCANHEADSLVRQFRERADGLGGMSLSTAREAIRSLLVGPNAYTAEQLQDEIRKVEPGTGVFDWVRRMKQARSTTKAEQPKCTGAIYQ